MTAHRPTVPEGTCVYAVGDIHGRLDLLTTLHGMIERDAARRAAERRVLIYLGDYVDRGPDSRGVIDLLCTAPLPGFETVHLIGNHEAYLLHFLDDPDVATIWFYNGGDRTLESYGVHVVDESRTALPALQAAFREALPKAHLDFLRRLLSSRVEGDYAFVHAGILPGLPLAEQRPEDMMWIREEFLYSPVRHDHVVVHGHSISWRPEVRRNRIGIDTGAFVSGVLTALVLEGAERDFLQAT